MIKEKRTILWRHLEISYTEALKKKQKQCRLPGFRRGNVPLDIVRKQYHTEVWNNVVQHALQEDIKRCMAEEYKNKVFWMQPTYSDLISNFEDDVSYTLNVYVQDKIIDVENIEESLKSQELPLFESNSGDEDFWYYVKNHQSMQREVEIKDPVHEESVVYGTLRISQAQEKEPYEHTNFALHLGKNDVDKSDIEASLGKEVLSKNVKDVINVKHHLPKKFSITRFSGKKVSLSFEIERICIQKDGEVDENFLQQRGYASKEDYQKALRKDFDEYREKIQFLLKRKAVTDRIVELCRQDIDIPEKILDEEKRFVEYTLRQQAPDAHFANRDELIAFLCKGLGIDQKEFENVLQRLAWRRALLSRALRSIADAHNISLSQEESQRILLQELSKYPGEESEIIKYYTRHQEAYARLMLPHIEDKVVSWCMSFITWKEAQTLPLEDLEKKAYDY